MFLYLPELNMKKFVTRLIDFTDNSPVRKEYFFASVDFLEFRDPLEFPKSYLQIILLDDSSQVTKTVIYLSNYTNSHHKTIVVLFDKTLYAPETIWKLLEAGASLVVDFENTPFVHELIKKNFERWDTIESLLNSDYIKQYLIGETPIWKHMLRELIEVSVFTDSSILIMGESGSGKERLSGLVHRFDTRKQKGEFHIVDCSTVAGELSGSEFYGHEKGAYTGANTSRQGAFDIANNGTLFLDEVGELPLRLQGELLRVIQEGTFKPLGSNSWKKSTFRLVSATNRSLEKEIEEQRFRLDLYFRLSTWKCKIPSLDKRKEDIPLLVTHFLKKYFTDEVTPKIEDMVMNFLVKRKYIGNVRELEQIIRRMACRHIGRHAICLGDISSGDRPTRPTTPDSPFNLVAYEKAIDQLLNQGYNFNQIKNITSLTAIERAIEMADGKIKIAADQLGISSRAIQIHRSKKNL